MKTLFTIMLLAAMYIGYQSERAATPAGNLGCKAISITLAAAAVIMAVEGANRRTRTTPVPKTIQDTMWPVNSPADLPEKDGFYPVQYRNRKGETLVGVGEMVSGHFINMRRYEILAVGNYYETLAHLMSDTNTIH